MTKLFKDGTLYYNGKFQDLDFLIDDEGNIIIADHFDLDDEVDEVIDCAQIHIMPGLIDPHVHLRQPGQEYKETIKTGTMAAARGGVTTIFSMPNLNPAPDSLENLQVQQNIIRNDAVVHVYPICAITKGQKGRGELVDFKALSEESFLFSDDGVGIQDKELMKKAMEEVAAVNGVLIEHCEDESALTPNWSLHNGKKCQELGLIGNDSASEYNEVIRNIELARQTGCQLHICHVSTKESVEAIRKAKKEGLNISCEVTPHHLFLNDEDIKEDNGKYKMNPPIRSVEDQQALLEGIKDGTIEMIATDHAPHSEEEKNCPIKDAKNGVVGIEISFPLVYTKLVNEKIISLEKAIELMSFNAANIFGIEGGEIINLQKANLAFFNLRANQKVNASKFVSMGKSTPFDGQTLQSKCVMSIVDGEIVYREGI